MTAEIGRWLIALGVVAAAVGFTVFGMSMAYYQTDHGQKNLAIILMAAGGVAVVIGAIASFVAGELKAVPEEQHEATPTRQ